jgi:hypothetical protein
MTSPQSKVTSLDYGGMKALPEGEPTRDLLRDAITNCHTLQRVSGFPGILDLLERGIPEIALKAMNADLDAAQLTRVLGCGGVTQLSLKSDLFQPHQSLATAVFAANAKLPGDQCVREVELETFSARTQLAPDVAADVVCPLLATKRLEKLRLPNPHWLSGAPMNMASLAERHSLESLTFAEEDRIDEKTNAELAGIHHALGRNRLDRHHRTTGGAALALTAAMTKGMLENHPVDHLRMHAGLPVEELANHLKAEFGSTMTPTGQAITSVNRETGNAAHDEHFKPEVHHLRKMSAPMEDVLRAAQEGDAPKLAVMVAELGTATVLAYAAALRENDPNAARDLLLARLHVDFGTPQEHATYSDFRTDLQRPEGESSVVYADLEARIPNLEEAFQNNRPQIDEAAFDEMFAQMFNLG